MEKIFKLSKNKTTVRTEILAGLTTFMTMSYIIALNPNLLADYDKGSPLWNGVFLATCISSALGTICMAFLANKPFAMAPGMGINTFLAVVISHIAVVNDTSYETAFQAGLSIILVEGLIFLMFSILDLREKIVEAIPLGIRLGISPALGLFLMDIGFGSNLRIFAEESDHDTPFYALRDFFGAFDPQYLKEKMGNVYDEMVISVVAMIIGLIVIIVLAKKKVRSAVLLGMLTASAAYWLCEGFILDQNPFASLGNASFVPPFKDLADTTLFKFDFKGMFGLGIVSVVTLIITFCIIDMFDTIGSLFGAASTSGMIDNQGKMDHMKEAFVSDAIGTIAGACTGTSTVNTYVESASGVEAGGRTGLTALTTGIMFLACMFIAPIAAIIPSAATSSALIFVGILMLKELQKINFNDLDQFVPVIIMLLAMPVTASIGNSIGLALIIYTLIKVFSGKGKSVSILTYILSFIFLVKFFVLL